MNISFLEIKQFTQRSLDICSTYFAHRAARHARQLMKPTISLGLFINQEPWQAIHHLETSVPVFVDINALSGTSSKQEIQLRFHEAKRVVHKNGSPLFLFTYLHVKSDQTERIASERYSHAIHTWQQHVKRGNKTQTT